MNKGQGFTITILSVAVALLGSLGLIRLNSDVAVNKQNIETTQETLGKAESRISMVEKAYAETSLQQANINGKLDVILKINGYDPKKIEKEVENKFASTTLSKLNETN